MLPAWSEIAAEERKKRTLGVRLGNHEMARGVSNSGSWHRATRASLENAFQTFGIDPVAFRLRGMTRSGPLLTKQEGAWRLKPE